jgi:hypothetical protein
MNPLVSTLQTGAIDLIGTATAFGQGAIASAISGNPYYSQDPAAANYATSTGVVGSSSSLLPLLLLALVVYLVVKK